MKVRTNMNRIISVIVLICFSVLTIGGPALANDKITMRKKFMGGYLFKVGPEKQKPVFGFTNMSFNDDFKNTLSTFPPALAEAKKGLKFHRFNFIVKLSTLAFIVSEVFDAGKSDPDPIYSPNWTPIIIGGVANTVLGLLGMSKVKNGVRMYNENIRTQTTTSPTSAIDKTETSSTSSSTFGFMTGLNIANQDILNPTKESIIGLTFGGFMTFPISKDILIQAETRYSVKGCKVEALSAGERGHTVTYTYTYKLSYLDLPVLFKYNTPSIGTTQSFVYAGPSLGILMSANGEIDNLRGDPDLIEVGSGNGDIKPMYSNTDFSLLFGAGINLSNNVSFDTRYTMGLFDIGSDQVLYKINNSTFSIMLGYTL